MSVRRSLRINCDLGEGAGQDAAIMPLIDQASIACGGHAGTSETMRTTVALAVRHAVEIGAHPSYPDREGFGRVALDMPAGALASSLQAQLDALRSIAKAQDCRVTYIKPHGALYHAVAADPAHRAVVLDLARRAGMPLVVQAAASASVAARPVAWIEAAKASGVDCLFEAFADRAYEPEGKLLSRAKPGALLEAAGAEEQARQIAEQQTVTATDGRQLHIAADTLCIHGDHPQAAELARRVRAAVVL